MTSFLQNLRQTVSALDLGSSKPDQVASEVAPSCLDQASATGQRGGEASPPRSPVDVKATAMSEAYDRRHRELYANMKKLDVKEAHARCFTGGNSGAIRLKGS